MTMRSASTNTTAFSTLRGTNHQVGLQFDRDVIDYVDEYHRVLGRFVDHDRIVIHSHSYPGVPG